MTTNMDSIDLDAIRDRVWSKVQKKEPDECWPWTGGLQKARNQNRYGRLNVRIGPRKDNKTVTLKAHQLVYMLVHGSIPQGLGVLHTCHNSACCNPDHLYEGTHDQNMQDMVDAKRSLKKSQNPKSKLHEKDVREIRRLRKKGKTLRDIAAQFDIHLATVGLICQGKTW